MMASGEMWFECLRNKYVFFSKYKKKLKRKKNKKEGGENAIDCL